MYERVISAAFILLCFSFASTILADADVDDDFNPQGYFTFRHDLRECVSPLCGGIFVKAVNQKFTRCADGIKRRECYVAVVKNPYGIDFGSASLLQGRIKPKIFPNFGNLGVFRLKAAFSSATESAGTGKFFGLQNNGIVCITSPCFSYDQYVLNREKFRTISGIDLEAVGAPKEKVDKAWAIIGEGGTLIAAGRDKKVEELAGTGVTFTARQFYLPIPPTKLPICSAQ